MAYVSPTTCGRKRKRPSLRRAALACAVLSLAAGTGHAGDEQVVVADGKPGPGFTMMVGDPQRWDVPVIDGAARSDAGYLVLEPLAAAPALAATWNGKGEAQLYVAATAGPEDLSPLAASDTSLVMLMSVAQPPKKKVELRMGCQYPCGASADITKMLRAVPTDQWFRVSFDLACFASEGLDVRNVDVPFLMWTRGRLAVSLADVRLVPGTAGTATVRCR